MSSPARKKKRKPIIPKSPLIRRALELREQAIAEGMTLLTADEILEEVKRRRGEAADCES